MEILSTCPLWFLAKNLVQLVHLFYNNESLFYILFFSTQERYLQYRKYHQRKGIQPLELLDKEDYIDSLVVYDPKENPHEHESIR